MDPGNWATDLEGGTRFGYQLLWVLVASNLVALLLQSLAARLGLVAGADLAEACRRHFSTKVNFSLWFLAELAIIACDLAELLGSAVALNLLFGVPMVYGALLTLFDVFLILALQRRGADRLEATVLTLLVTIAVCLGFELVLAKPNLAEVASGLRPTLSTGSLYVAIGIVGATIMPHNLYLHSALEKRQGRAPDAVSQRRVLRRSFYGTALALNLALLVNAAILVLAAAVFSKTPGAVSDLQSAYHLLAPVLGTGLASVLFAVGLLCSGTSATITGTLAGQIVMEGFLRIKLPAFQRRALTRGVAIVPAVAVLAWAGESGTMRLLLASQVILSLQLPFAIVPLIRFTSDAQLMGRFANASWIRFAAGASGLVITAANGALISRTLEDLRQHAPIAAGLFALAALAALALLGWVCVVPLRRDGSGEITAVERAEWARKFRPNS
jgi:manganese transport protein